MSTESQEKDVVTQHRLQSDLMEKYNKLDPGIPPFLSPSPWDVWYVEMPETKIAKFLRQFHWIQNLIDGDDIRQVYVSGIDSRMIHRTIESPWACEDITHEHAFLLDENGSPVFRMVKETVSLGRKYLFWGPEKFQNQSRKIGGDVPEGDTINHILRELGDEFIQKIRFILSYDEWTRVAIVYKRPKDTDFWKWVKDEVEATEPKIAESTVT